MKRLGLLLLLLPLLAACTSGTEVPTPKLNTPFFVSESALPPGAVTVPYTTALITNGGTLPHTFSLATGFTAPPGLTLSSSGTLSGVPAVEGSYAMLVVITDSGAPSLQATRQFTLDIAVQPLAITTSSLPVAVAGSPYSAALASTGGVAPHSFDWQAGITPPAWASLASDGTLTGTPPTGGNEALTFAVTDADSTVSTRQLNLTINDTLELDTTDLPNGEQGQAYSQQLVATGGLGPYTFTFKPGFTPPAWANLSSSGLLTGIPMNVESLALEIRVSDNFSPQGADDGTISLEIDAAPLRVETEDLLVAVKGYGYNLAITGFGGQPPYAFAITSGGTPNGGSWDLGTTGISMDGSGAMTGTYSGNGPNFTHNFTVQVTDSVLATASRNLALEVILPPKLASTGVPRAMRGDPYGFTLAHDGPSSIEPVTFAVSGGTLPAGITLGGDGSLTGTTTEVGLDVITVSLTLSHTSGTVVVNGSFDFVVYQDIPYTYAADGNEPNNSAGTATVLGIIDASTPAILGGPLSVDSYNTNPAPDPNDYFRVQTTTVGEIKVECFFASLTGGLALTLHYYDLGTHVLSPVAYGYSGEGGDDELLVYRNAQPGFYYVQVTAPSDPAFGSYTSNAYALRVSFSDLTIATSLLEIDLDATPAVDAQVVAYNQGAAPAAPVWSLLSGTLPTGISFGADGKFTGATTAYNIYSFTLQVTDGGLTATAAIQVRFYNAAVGNFWLVKGERRDYSPPGHPIRSTYAEAMVVAPHPDYPTEGAMWLLGGREAATINEVAIFHTDRAGIPTDKQFKFEQVAKPLVTSRRYHGAAFIQHSYGGYIYVVGGEIGAPSGGHSTGDFWYGVERLQVADASGVALAHPLSTNWQVVANLPQLLDGKIVKGWAEFGLAAGDAGADADDRLYLVAGRNQVETAPASGSYTKAYHSLVLMLECPTTAVGTGSWHVKTDSAYTGRRFPAVGMVNGRIFIGAGRGVAGNLNTFEMYQPDPAGANPALAVAPASSFPTLPVDVYFPMCAVLNGHLYIWCGWDNGLAGTKHLHRFTPTGPGTGGMLTQLQSADWGTGFGPGVAHDGKLWIISGVGHLASDQPRNLRYTP